MTDIKYYAAAVFLLAGIGTLPWKKKLAPDCPALIYVALWLFFGWAFVIYSPWYAYEAYCKRRRNEALQIEFDRVKYQGLSAKDTANQRGQDHS